jgi:hypothetical protein
MTARRHIILAIGLTLGLSLAGCGGGEDSLPRLAISGRVTLDGKPLEHGSITFTPADAGRADATTAGASISDGSYSVAQAGGPTPGNYRVAILGAEEGSAPAPGERPTRSAVAKSPIPEEYNTRSSLKAEIKADGSKTFDYELKSH